MSANAHNNLRLISGNAHPALGEKLARQLDIPLTEVNIDTFADGETHVHIVQEVQGAVVCIVQPVCPPVNDHLMTLALLIDAARAAGARRVIALTPYLGYARQDRRDRRGDPRSFQVVSRWLGAVGLDHLVTLDLHSPALESALPMPTSLLKPEAVFLPQLKSWQMQDPVVASPDAGGLKCAQHFALALDVPVAVIAKERPKKDIPVPREVLGEVKDRDCLVIDDMASTGRTLAAAAEALRAAGARHIYAIFTHAVMAPGAVEKLFAAQFRKGLTTDSIPVSPDDWLEVISIVPLLAKTVQSLLHQG